MKKNFLTVALIACLFLTFGIVAAQDAPEKKAENEAQIKEIKPFKYCALEMTGSYDQHETAYLKLYEEAGKQGLPTDQQPIGIYFNGPQQVPVEELKWEVGFEVPAEQAVQAPLLKKEWTFTTLASLVYEGKFDENMQSAYGKLFAWIGQNGYQMAGPLMEKSLSMPVKDENNMWSGKMEILVPVKKVN